MRTLAWLLVLGALAACAPSRPGPVRPGTPSPRAGEPDPARLTEVLRGRLDDLTACYEARLEHRPELGGKLSTRITIEADGSVSEVTILESGLRDPELEACIVARLSVVRFPAAAEGFVLEVPWSLSPWMEQAPAASP